MSPTQTSPAQMFPSKMSLTDNLSTWENLTSPLAKTNLTSSLATTHLNQTWPPETSIGYLTLFGFSGVLALSILGNGLVIVSFFRDVRLRVIFNLFVVHLATADVIMSFLVVLTLMDHFTHLSLLRHWPLLCQVCTVLAQAIPLEQVVLLHLICHDRRRALRLGLSYSRHIGQWHMHKMLLVLTWGVTVVFSYLLAEVMSTVEHFSYRSRSLHHRLVYVRYSSCLHLLLLASLAVNVAYITWGFRKRRQKGSEFEPLANVWEQEPTFHVQFPNDEECPRHTGCLEQGQCWTSGQYANHGRCSALGQCGSHVQCPEDDMTGVLPPLRHPPLVPRAALTDDFERTTLLATPTRSFRSVVQMMLSTHTPRHRRSSRDSLVRPSRLVNTNNHRKSFPWKSSIFEHDTETEAFGRHDQELVTVPTSTMTIVVENYKATDETKNSMKPKENPRKASVSFSEGTLTVQGSMKEASTRFSFISHQSGSPRMDKRSVSRRSHNRKTNDALKTGISPQRVKPSLLSPECGCCRISAEAELKHTTIPPASNWDEDDRKTSLDHCLRTDDWLKCGDVFSTLNFTLRSVPTTVCKSCYSCFGADLKAEGVTDISTRRNFHLLPPSKSASASTFRVSEQQGLVSEIEMIHHSPYRNLNFKSIPLATSMEDGFRFLALSEVDVRHPAVFGANRVKRYLTFRSGCHSESFLLLRERDKDVNVSQVSYLSSDVKDQSYSKDGAKLGSYPDADSRENVSPWDCARIVAKPSANTLLKRSQPEISSVNISQVDSSASKISQPDNISVVSCQHNTGAYLVSLASSVDFCTSQHDNPAITAEQGKTTHSITTKLDQTNLPGHVALFQSETSVELVPSANHSNGDPQEDKPDLLLANSHCQPSDPHADLRAEATTCHTRDSTSCHTRDSTSCHTRDSTSCHTRDSISCHNRDSTSCHTRDSTSCHTRNSTSCHTRDSTSCHTLDSTSCHTRNSTINANNNADSDESVPKSDTNNVGQLGKDDVVAGGRTTVLNDANQTGSFTKNSENVNIFQSGDLQSMPNVSSTRPILPLVLVDGKAKTSEEEQMKDTEVFSLELAPSNGMDNYSPQCRTYRGELSDDKTKSYTYNSSLSRADLETARNDWLQFYGISTATMSPPNRDFTPKSSCQHSINPLPAEVSLVAARRIWLDFYGISDISAHDFSPSSTFPSQSAHESFPNAHLSPELTNTVPNIPRPKPLLKQARIDTRSQKLEELKETRDSTKRYTEDTAQHPGSTGLRLSRSAEFTVGKSHRTRLEYVVEAVGKKLKISSSALAKSKTEKAELPFSPARSLLSRSAPLKRISVATSQYYSDRKPSRFKTTQEDSLGERDMSKETVTYLCGLLGHQLLDTAGQTSEPMASPKRNLDFPGVVSDQGGSGASKEKEGGKVGFTWAARQCQDLHTVPSPELTKNRTRIPGSKQRGIKVTEDTVSLSAALGTSDEFLQTRSGLKRQDSLYCPHKLDSLDPINAVPFFCQESCCSSDRIEYNAHSLAGSPNPAIHERHLQAVGSETELLRASPLASSDCQGYNLNQKGSCKTQNSAVTKDQAEGATGLGRAELPMQVDNEEAECSPLQTVECSPHQETKFSPFQTVESWSVTSRALLVELGIYQDVLTGAIPLDLDSLARRETRCSVPPCPDCQKRVLERRQQWLARGQGLGLDVDEGVEKSNRSNNALTDVFQQEVTIVRHQLPSYSCSGSSTMTAGDTSPEISGQGSGSQGSGQESCLLVLPGLGHQFGGMTRNLSQISSAGIQHTFVRPPKRWICPISRKHLSNLLCFEQLKKRDAELSILMSLICLVMLQLLCWLPIAATYLVYDITGFPSHVTSTELVFLLVWCARMAIQPLLYAYYSAFFRENYSQLVCCS